MLSKKQKRIIFSFVVITILSVFFFPKVSTEEIAETGNRKDCNCFGFKHKVESSLESTSIHCFGISYDCKVEQVYVEDIVLGDNDEKLTVVVDFTNYVSIFYPDGSRKDTTIKQEIGIDVAGYCQPVKDLIIKALDDMSLEYELRKDTESEYFSSIDGIENSETKSWKVYLNDILSPYDINNHCYEDTWSLKLRYE